MAKRKVVTVNVGESAGKEEYKLHNQERAIDSVRAHLHRAFLRRQLWHLGSLVTH